MKKAVFSLVLGLVACISIVSAQPRPVGTTSSDTKTTVKRTAPATFEARYEGGIFGYGEREKGTLKFDDLNERLVFLGKKDGKEMFSIPYKAMLVIFPSAKKVQSGTGRTISAVPILGAGIAGSLLKKKKNYLVIQYRDPDVEIQGTTSFLIDTNELLESVVYTLGEKADMKQRGDAFYRPTEKKTTL